MRELDLGLSHEDEDPALTVTGDHGRHGRRGRRRGRRVIPALVVLLVLGGFAAALVAGGAAVFHRLGQGAPDWKGAGTGQVVVHVHEGDSLTAVGQTLVASGVVRSVGAFTHATAGRADADKLQPGYYRLHQHMGAAAALDLLLDPASRLSSQVSIPEGSTIKEVVAALAGHSKLTQAQLSEASKDPATLGIPSWAHGHVEGLLFPATYQVDPGSKATTVLAGMVTKFQSVAADIQLQDDVKALKVSPYDAVIIASIVEKEAGVAGDYPKVARVLYNRLAQGMPLQVDSTLEYVLPHRKGHLSDADLRTRSPYNLYQHKGLPPTAIDSPGKQALLAALHPAAGNWIYFITVDKQGHSAFTNSYDEFLKLKAKAQREGVY